MTLSPDMTFWINTLIFNELDKICPSLSLNGEDRKVYEICIQDFRNYIGYLERNHQKLDESENQELKIHQGEHSFAEVRDLEDVLSILITNRLYGLHEDLQGTKEIAEFIHVWVQWWWRKWQERTKILFNEKDIPVHITGTALNLSMIFTPEEYKELMQTVTDKLIQYGEICCGEIIADGLLKKDIQTNQKTEWSVQDKIQFIPRVQREAREMSFTHGPLVFIKPKKGYGLREWRDDGANKIV
jgi:hypothetical protein